MTDYFEAIIIGSGFGGTILALSLANKFEADNNKDEIEKRVCLLERGQWWLSHEMSFAPRAGRRMPPNLREYLEDNGRPYHFWPHPDNVSGIIELLSTDRTISKAGLFDYKVLGNVHSIQASGVGGGSLVYSNVTLPPNSSIFASWPAAENNQVLKNIANGMRQLAGEMDAGGSKRVYTPFLDFKDPRNSTAVILHTLGGCPMGRDVDEGVINSYGQVFWRDDTASKVNVYPGLYVV